jgi:hypothetical protein
LVGNTDGNLPRRSFEWDQCGNNPDFSAELFKCEEERQVPNIILSNVDFTYPSPFSEVLVIDTNWKAGLIGASRARKNVPAPSRSAFAYLKFLLLDGGLEPDDIISTEGVAQSLSVSRAP